MTAPLADSNTASNPAPASFPAPAPAPTSGGTDMLTALISATVQFLLHSQVNTRKEEVAWTLNHLAQVVRQTEREMLQSDHTSLVRYTDATAASLESAAAYLHDHDLQAIIKDGERLAQERPALVAGVLLAFGIVLARFLKNTAPAKA
jgi:hypothetical protein